MATLHRELLGDAAPRGRLLMTHGIYGSGGNWRTIARRVLERSPGWGAVLVDLRGHGRSELGAPPHTVEACARDLAALAREVGDVRVTCGHSFGGKCVLALRPLLRPVQTWVLDATPSARPAQWNAHENTVRQVLDLMERMPPRFARRDDFVQLAIDDGQTRTLAQWLAMNLEPDDRGGLRLRLDLDMIRGLLLDYYAQDLWRDVEDPSLPGEVHVVVAGRGHALSPEDVARLGARAHVIPDAGHWLNVDAPDAIVDLLAGALV